MIRSCILLCALVFGLGCAADGNNGQWNEVLKDLRGDNMQMWSHDVDTKGLGQDPIQTKPGN